MTTPACVGGDRAASLVSFCAFCAAATLAVACLREPPARPVVVPRAVASAPAPAVSASAAAKSRWVEGQGPGWRGGPADCGVKEATYDVTIPFFTSSRDFDLSTCASSRGCPAATTAPMQWCAASTDPVVDFDAFLDDPSLWRDEQTIRLRGRFFLHDPRRVAGIMMPLETSDRLERACAPGADAWTSSMQLLRGDRCYSVPLWGYFPSCAGDVSRSCCGNLPMGERIVVTARLTVNQSPQAAGQYYAVAHVIEACRE